jgi:hypothetical protein
VSPRKGLRLLPRPRLCRPLPSRHLPRNQRRIPDLLWLPMRRLLTTRKKEMKRNMSSRRSSVPESGRMERKNIERGCSVIAVKMKLGNQRVIYQSLPSDAMTSVLGYIFFHNLQGYLPTLPVTESSPHHLILTHTGRASTMMSARSAYTAGNAEHLQSAILVCWSLRASGLSNRKRW